MFAFIKIGCNFKPVLSSVSASYTLPHVQPRYLSFLSSLTSKLLKNKKSSENSPTEESEAVNHNGSDVNAVAADADTFDIGDEPFLHDTLPGDSASESLKGRRKWSLTEDDLLRTSVKELGPQWGVISKLFKDRSRRSCAARWFYFLKPYDDVQFTTKIPNSFGTISNDDPSAPSLHSPQSLMYLEHKKWTREDDAKLMAAISKHDFDWTLISKDVGRGMYACRYRWFGALRPGLKHGPWTEGEDNVLRTVIQDHQRTYLEKRGQVFSPTKPTEMWSEALKTVKWSTVADELGRSEWAVRYRALSICNPGYMNGHWLPHEEATFHDLIREYGPQFTLISQKLGSRSPIQCFEKWSRVANPLIQKGKWKKEEDQRLRKAFATYGPRWFLLARVMETRTSVQCRDRYLRLAFYDGYYRLQTKPKGSTDLKE